MRDSGTGTSFGNNSTTILERDAVDMIVAITVTVPYVLIMSLKISVLPCLMLRTASPTLSQGNRYFDVGRFGLNEINDDCVWRRADRSIFAMLFDRYWQ